MKQKQDSIQANIIVIYTGSPDTEITGQPEEPLAGSNADADNVTGQPEPAQVHEEVLE